MAMRHVMAGTMVAMSEVKGVMVAHAHRTGADHGVPAKAADA